MDLKKFDYTEFGINDALVIDNTGAFTTEEALRRHLSSNGAQKSIALQHQEKECLILFMGSIKMNTILIILISFQLLLVLLTR
jgi:glyceraldehyde-3-phosphate dehydrogenase/erythrose-4-phosphate dehydrogenase